MADRRGLFTSIGGAVDSAFNMLADPSVETQELTNDRVAIGGAGYFTTVDQQAVSNAAVGTRKEEVLASAVDLPGSKVSQGERFFLIAQVDWTTDKTVGQALGADKAGLDVVKELMATEFAVDGLLKYHAYARFGLEVIVQINPTNFQAGGLITALVPAGELEGSLASLTTYCHGILNCNINNVVKMRVPFVYSRGMYNLRDPAYTPWVLVLRCWSPLQVATGTSTMVTVSVLARFTYLEMHGLTPLYSQMMRNEFRISTTQNVMNLANYEDSMAKVSLALDQEDWRSDVSSAGDLKVTNFRTWTEIPCYSYSFSYSGASEHATLIWANTVDPYTYGMHVQEPGEAPSGYHSTNLSSVASQYAYWRGDIVFDFEVFCTPFHSGRLLIVYVPGSEKTPTASITMRGASTGLCATFDIKGVNSTLRFRCPYVSDTPYRTNPFSGTYVVGSLKPYATGKILVYVYNRLQAPPTVSPSINVIVYKSAQALELFAPLWSAIDGRPALATTQAGDDEAGFSTNETVQQVNTQPKQELKSTRELTVTPEGVVTALEDPKISRRKPGTFPETGHGYKRHTSDHMNIYKFMGRAHYLFAITFTKTDVQYTFPLHLDTNLYNSSSDVLGLEGTLRWFLHMIQLYRGPIDISFAFSGDTNVDGIIYFTPAGVGQETDSSEVASKLTMNYKAATGMVRFNTARTNNVQLRLPWYSNLYACTCNAPLTGDIDGLYGHISIQITSYNVADENLRVTAYLSFTPESEFLVPRACPSYHWMRDDTPTTMIGTGHGSAVNGPSRARRDLEHLFHRQNLAESSVDSANASENEEETNAIYENINPSTRAIPSAPPYYEEIDGDTNSVKVGNYFSEVNQRLGLEVLPRGPIAGIPKIGKAIDEPPLHAKVVKLPKVGGGFASSRSRPGTPSIAPRFKSQCEKCILVEGDVVICKVPTGKHYGVYVGSGVVHVDPDGVFWTMKKKALVLKSHNMKKWCKAPDEEQPPMDKRSEITSVAIAMIGQEVDYNIFKQNCETWAKAIAGIDTTSKEGKRWSKLLTAVSGAALISAITYFRHECWAELKLDLPTTHEIVGAGVSDHSPTTPSTQPHSLVSSPDPGEGPSSPVESSGMWTRLKARTIGTMSKMVVPEAISSTTAEVKSLVNDAKGFFRRVKEALYSMQPDMSGFPWKKVVKWTLIALRLALSIGIMWRTDWDPTVMSLVTALFAVDVGATIITAAEIMDAMLNKFCTLVPEMDNMTSQSPFFTSKAFWKETNLVLSVCKNMKEVVLWVMEEVRELFEQISGQKEKETKELEDNKMVMAQLIAACDSMMISNPQGKELESFVVKGRDYVKALRTLYIKMATNSETSSFCPYISGVINSMTNKLKDLPIPETGILRAEPTVVYLYGQRGSGKSLCSMALAVSLCKQFGMVPTDSIYTQPFGSQYWDGYRQQPIVIMDDIGQLSDDSEWASFCQMVSTCPFRVNMAGLVEKGMLFDSPIIICTSNMAEPAPKTIYCREAIDRRLQIKVHVEARADYQVNGILQMMKARDDDKLKDLSCLCLTTFVGGKKEVTLDELINMVQSSVMLKAGQMDTFLHYFSQMMHKEGDDLTGMMDKLSKTYGNDFLRVNTFSEICSKMSEENQTWYSKLWSSICSNKYKILGAVAAVIGLVIASFVLYKTFDEDVKMTDEGAYSPRTPINKAVQIKHLGGTTTELPTSQTVIDMAALVQKNLIRVGYGPTEEKIQWVVNGLGLRKDLALIPSHAFMDAKEEDSMFLERNGTIYTMPIKDVIQIDLESRYSDVKIYKFVGIPPWRDLTKHFVSEEDLGTCMSLPATLCTMVSGMFQLVHETQTQLLPDFTYDHIHDDGHVEVLTVGRVVRAKASTVGGMCGGVLVSTSTRAQTPFLGIHIAGGNGHAATKLITQQMLENADRDQSQRSRVFNLKFDQPVVSTGSKTAYQKTPIHDEVKNEHEINYPASLFHSRQAEVDVAATMLSKYDSDVVEEPEGYSEVSIEYSNYLATRLDMKKELLSYQDCIEGIPGMDGLDMKTSAGLPYTLMHLTKKDLILDGQPIGQLKEDLERLEDGVMQGAVPNIEFTTVAKDELRGEEKVRLGKTRAIEVAPVHYTILFRRFFGRAVAALQSRPGFDINSAVGCDVDVHFHQWAQEINAFGDELIDLDFRNFDASLSPFMLFRAYNILGMLSGIDTALVEALVSPIVYSKHRVSSIQYTVEGGMPSGAPATSVVNSLINSTNLWFVIMQVFKCSFSQAMKLFKIITYGDDVLMVWNREQGLLPSESLPLMQQSLTNLGLSATGGDKGAVRVKTLQEISFLSRHFVMDSYGIIHPALKEVSIYSLLAWKRKTANFAELELVLSDAESRRRAEHKTEEGKKEKYFLFYDGETVSGRVILTLKHPNKRLEHQGIKVEFIGQIELYYDRGNHHEFVSLVKDLARPGEFTQSQTFDFEFTHVEKPYESYTGQNVKLRYFLRATVSRRLNDVVKEMDIVVHTLSTYPELNSSIKMEVGIEDCLHIEFEYNKSKYHLKDVIVGKIYFLLVRIKIKHMEIDIIKRETTGTGPNVYHENDTIAKYEIMDGAPVRGESIPIRLFLAGYELTPTMRDINKKFSVRYYLNLVLIDEEERRYFKQQEVVLWRKGDIVRKSMSHQAAIASQRFEGTSSHAEARTPSQPAENNSRQ